MGSRTVVGFSSGRQGQGCLDQKGPETDDLVEGRSMLMPCADPDQFGIAAICKPCSRNPLGPAQQHSICDVSCARLIPITLLGPERLELRSSKEKIIKEIIPTQYQTYQTHMGFLPGYQGCCDSGCFPPEDQNLQRGSAPGRACRKAISRVRQTDGHGMSWYVMVCRMVVMG